MSGFPTPARPASRSGPTLFPKGRVLLYLGLVALLLDLWLSPSVGPLFPGR